MADILVTEIGHPGYFEPSNFRPFKIAKSLCKLTVDLGRKNTGFKHLLEQRIVTPLLIKIFMILYSNNKEYENAST